MAAIHPLIVDFPTTTKINAVKTVRFSSTSTMKLVRYPTHDERVARWYSKNDENAFKRRRWRDVYKYSALLMQDDDGDRKEKIVRCVGIDHLLSQDIQTKSQEIMKARLDHVTLVLNVQELQRMHRICYPEDLARISAQSSRVAKERAQEVARLMGSL